MALNSNQKVHICAPSNAAIDEILSRIQNIASVGLKWNAEAQCFHNDGKYKIDPKKSEPIRENDDKILRIGSEQY